MELVLMRHAPTAGNLERRYLGATDEPLCARGESLARAAGSIPHIDCVFISPLLRARQTAAICFPQARRIVLDELREMDFGRFEGLRFEDLRDDDAYRTWVEGDCTERCPEGESRTEFIRRTMRAIEQVVALSYKCGASCAIVVAHGGTVMAALAAFATPSHDYFDWHVAHCCGWRAHVERDANGKLRLVEPQPFNDLGFLNSSVFFDL